MPPASTAPPSSSLLLPFCHFLLHRLQTDSLELLQRVVSEYLATPRRFDTVETMVSLGFPLVTLLPLDNADADERARATTVLTRMQQHPHEQSDSEFAEFHAALRSRLELKNWDWLAQIFGEFCTGEDHTLRKFVSLQQQAIAIVPVRPGDAVRDGTGSSPTSEAIVSTASLRESPPVVPTTGVGVRKAHRRIKPKMDESDRRRVFEELLAIEEQRPWEKVFDVSSMTFPFDEHQYPDLAAELRFFWQHHARAVWERSFWFIYGSADVHVDRQEQRKRRQDIATRSFEARIIARAYETIGPEFFVELDLKEPHYWWWIRQPVVDMLRLGASDCIQYVRTQAYTRFPDHPPWVMVAPKHNYEPSSMWPALAKYQEYRQTVIKMKAERLAQHAP